MGPSVESWIKSKRYAKGKKQKFAISRERNNVFFVKITYVLEYYYCTIYQVPNHYIFSQFSCQPFLSNRLKNTKLHQ